MFLKPVHFVFIFLILIIFSFLLFWTVVPIVENLLKGGFTLEGVQRNSSGVLVRFHVFNVSNPGEIEEGLSPELQEIGPLIYRVHRQKINVTKGLQDNSEIFQLKTNWFFEKNLSGKLTGDEIINIPHPLVLGSLVATATELPTYLPLVEKSLRKLYPKLSPFLSISIKDLLFDGFLIENCSVKPFCTIMKQRVKDLEVVDSTTFKISAFKNGTLSPTIEMSTQSIDLVTFASNSRPTLNFPEFCGTFPYNFTRMTKFEDLEVKKYEMELEAEKCDFLKNEDCPTSGFKDLFKCKGYPLFLTLPNFVKFQGSIPVFHSNEKHEENVGEILQEVRTGVPISIKKRFQLNILSMAFPQIENLKSMPEGFIPFFWFEEVWELDLMNKERLRKNVVVPLKFLYVFKWFVVVFSSSGLVLSIYYYFKSRNKITLDLESKNSSNIGLW